MYQYRRIIISGIAALLVLSMLAGLIVMIVQAKARTKFGRDRQPAGAGRTVGVRPRGAE